MRISKHKYRPTAVKPHLMRTESRVPPTLASPSPHNGLTVQTDRHAVSAPKYDSIYTFFSESGNPTVSCQCCTYGRFTSLRRALALFLAQDYQDAELLIFNTAPVPINLGSVDVGSKSVRVINNPVALNGGRYGDLGSVRNDALIFQHGSVFCLWDDDDLYLPYHLSQGVRGLIDSRAAAWEPVMKFRSYDEGGSFHSGDLILEAAAFVRMTVMRELGFAKSSGMEAYTWYWPMICDKTIARSAEARPSYAHMRGTNIAPCKMSGPDTVEKWEWHLAGNTDFGSGYLEPDNSVLDLYKNLPR